MHKKFEINQTKIKGSRQSGSKVVPHDSKSDLPLTHIARGSLPLSGPELSCVRVFRQRVRPNSISLRQSSQSRKRPASSVQGS